jgi:hypothetical protein
MRALACALLLAACAAPTKQTPRSAWQDIVVTCGPQPPDHLPTWKRWTWWTFLGGSVSAVALGTGLGVGLTTR